jgi:hypothetical protein
MKLGKPLYDKESKVYTCSVVDGTRTTEPTLAQTAELVEFIVQNTKGWFTKPLAVDWLTQRIKLAFDTPNVSEDFQGTITWAWTDLLISKETFKLNFKVVDVVADPKISLEDEDSAPDTQKSENSIVEIEDGIPTGNPLSPPIAIGPTRRQLQKESVMKARQKAARALFYAERLTQEYIHVFGDDTDWEDEGEEESDLEGDSR